MISRELECLIFNGYVYRYVFRGVRTQIGEICAFRILVLRWSSCFRRNFNSISPFGVLSIALEREFDDISN